MGNPTPTIYRMPRKSMPARAPSDRAKAKWEKHRKLVGKDIKLPKLKN